MNYKLYLGDCLEEMNKIKDKSVDLILCDLPYGTTQCNWDIVIPFNELWSQYNRIIKNNGAIVLFGQEPFSSYLRLSNIKDYKYDYGRGSTGVACINKNRDFIGIEKDEKYFFIAKDRIEEQIKRINESAN